MGFSTLPMFRHHAIDDHKVKASLITCAYSIIKFCQSVKILATKIKQFVVKSLQNKRSATENQTIQKSVLIGNLTAKFPSL